MRKRRIGTAKFFTLLLLLYHTSANFIGSKSTWDNLRIIPKDKMPKLTPLHDSDRRILMEGLDGVLSQTLQDKIWEMIWKRWCAYEDFCHSR
jgi:hypothetical protein